jgi:hypothetical protein
VDKSGDFSTTGTMTPIFKVGKELFHVIYLILVLTFPFERINSDFYRDNSDKLRGNSEFFTTLSHLNRNFQQLVIRHRTLFSW